MLVLDYLKKLPLITVATAFFALWGVLCVVMLQSWLYTGREDKLYGVLAFGVVLYGFVAMGYSAIAFLKPTKKRKRILWVLLIPVPLVTFVVLEWLY